jgi:signal transduction histidine kinase
MTSISYLLVLRTYTVSKGHGGELKVEAKEGEGVEFVIQLPCEKQNP